MTAVTVREAGPEDAEAWIRFLVAAQSQTYAHLIPSWAQTDRLTTALGQVGALASQLSSSGGSRLVALHGDDVLAVASAEPAPAAWEVELGLVPALAPRELQRLYVHPSQHGTGLADRLLDGVLSEPGATYLWLIDGNARAERFYARHGFAAVDEVVPAGESWGSVPMHRMVRG